MKLEVSRITQRGTERGPRGRVPHTPTGARGQLLQALPPFRLWAGDSDHILGTRLPLLCAQPPSRPTPTLQAADCGFIVKAGEHHTPWGRKLPSVWAAGPQWPPALWHSRFQIIRQQHLTSKDAQSDPFLEVMMLHFRDRDRLIHPPAEPSPSSKFNFLHLYEINRALQKCAANQYSSPPPKKT